MKNIKGFTVRSSGRVPDKFYIGCAEMFKIGDISEKTGIDVNKLEEIYLGHEAKLDKVVGVYYFPSRENAINALNELDEYLSNRGTGKVVFLTFEEMEYIRQALINEGSNIINVRNDLKKGIFDKFNS